MKTIHVEEDPRLGFEMTYDALEVALPDWSDLRRRVGRTAGLDGSLNLDYNNAVLRMDYLLETLHGFMEKMGIAEASDGLAA